ncbi:hypothetical protein HPT29_026735 (plasmid) [Microvirga terrae]|uniref:Transposase DDE domain-containing protein n=1 Tax=Microvirga terrae TaxID=2740529 RepID=A0ABY5S155_9HYPH|nr:hypothetical protein [Microvirga terrae]UVF22279.1 hypothetical protein HPT29_026735 [Microvirga terrae]
MRNSHLRLVAVDGTQVAPAPRRPRGWNVRREREIRLCIIKEHLGHVTHSLNRLKTLADELEESLGISIPDFTPWPRPDALSGPPDASA